MLPDEKLKLGIVVAGPNQHWRIVEDSEEKFLLCESDLKVREVKMFLRFNSDLRALHVIVYNLEFLYKFKVEPPSVTPQQ